MGLNNETPKTFLGIYKGEINLRVTADTPGAVSRQNEEKETVYEKRFDNVSGYLTKIESRDGKFGKQWQLTISDAGTDYLLQFGYSSGYARSFFRALPNVNFEKQIKFSPYFKEKIDNGKKIQIGSLYLNQGGDQSVQWLFTKDEPNGLPEAPTVNLNGVDQINYTPQMLFFEDMLKDINHKIADANDLRNLQSDYSQAANASYPVSPDEANDMPPDDLPF